MSSSAPTTVSTNNITQARLDSVLSRFDKYSTQLDYQHIANNDARDYFPLHRRDSTRLTQTAHRRFLERRMWRSRFRDQMSKHVGVYTNQPSLDPNASHPVHAIALDWDVIQQGLYPELLDQEQESNSSAPEARNKVKEAQETFMKSVLSQCSKDVSRANAFLFLYSRAQSVDPSELGFLVLDTIQDIVQKNNSQEYIDAEQKWLDHPDRSQMTCETMEQCCRRWRPRTPSFQVQDSAHSCIGNAQKTFTFTPDTLDELLSEATTATDTAREEAASRMSAGIPGRYLLDALNVIGRRADEKDLHREAKTSVLRGLIEEDIDLSEEDWNKGGNIGLGWSTPVEVRLYTSKAPSSQNRSTDP